MKRFIWLLVPPGLLVMLIPFAQAQPLAQSNYATYALLVPIVAQLESGLLPNPPTPTGTPTTAPTVTRTATATSTPIVPPAVLDLSDLDTVYYVDDDIDVVGTLTAVGAGVPNIAVTVRFTINGADQGIWCTTATDVNGDWDCPTKTVPSAWLNKEVRITATAIVQGRSLTDSDNFTITPD